jgi:hypothetical protein
MSQNEEEEWENQINAIDAELLELGGRPIYYDVPEELIDTNVFTNRRAVFQKTRQDYEDGCLKIKHERDQLEMEMGYDDHVEKMGRPEQQKREERRVLLNKQEMQAERHFNMQKQERMEFLLRARPLDRKTYLMKKHKLLDDKLDLLEKLPAARLLLLKNRRTSAAAAEAKKK